MVQTERWEVQEVRGNKGARTRGGHVEAVTVHWAVWVDRAPVEGMAGVVGRRDTIEMAANLAILAVALRQVGLEVPLNSQVRKDKTGLMVGQDGMELEGATR
jgi:hypothetical protein